MSWLIKQQLGLQGKDQIEFNIFEGNISCNANGQKASMDSYLTCFLFQLPFFLETIGFGYICFPLIFAIILISIFGKIKENYKYFILNQALWDLLVIYNFICSKPSWNAWFEKYLDFYKDWLRNVNEAPVTCFYTINNFNSTETYFTHAFKTFFSSAAEYASYAPLFLLTFSRFGCLYFQYFINKKTTKPLRIFFFIAGFNLTFVGLVNIYEWVQLIQEYFARGRYQNCLDACHGGACNHTEEILCQLNLAFGIRPLPYFRYIQLALPPFLLILSNIFAFLLIFKLLKQLKFRVQNNRKSLLSSLKIACVIGFQCFTMSFLCFANSLEDGIWIYHNSPYYWKDIQMHEEYILQNWASWLRFLSLEQTVQCFMVLRIFVDSIIILIVFNGYRENTIGFMKSLLMIFIRPKIAIKQIKFKFNKNAKVTYIGRKQSSNKRSSLNITVF